MNMTHAKRELESQIKKYQELDKTIADKIQGYYVGKYLENIVERQKIALMPKIRIKNVSDELEIAKKLFSQKNIDLPKKQQ